MMLKRLKKYSEKSIKENNYPNVNLLIKYQHKLFYVGIFI